MQPQFVRQHLRGIQEVAEVFAVSPDTVREWREAGAPFLFIGRKWQISYQELWEWLKSHYSQKLVN